MVCVNANWEIAERYLAAIESTCQLIIRHKQLGPRVGFSHPRLRDWRFMVVFRPFQKHIPFYEIIGDELLFRRAMHGQRNLPQRLIEPPIS